MAIRQRGPGYRVGNLMIDAAIFNGINYYRDLHHELNQEAAINVLIRKGLEAEGVEIEQDKKEGQE